MGATTMQLVERVMTNKNTSRFTTKRKARKACKKICKRGDRSSAERASKKEMVGGRQATAWRFCHSMGA